MQYECKITVLDTKASAILAWRAAVFSQTMIMMCSAKSGKWLIRCNGGISCNTNVK